MKSSANAILSVLLSVCILFGAVKYVSAEILTGEADRSTEKSDVPDSIGSENSAAGKNTDGEFSLSENTKNSVLPDIEKAEETPKNASVNASEKTVAAAENGNDDAENKKNGTESVKIPVKSKSAEYYSLAEHSEEDALFDDFDYTKQFYTAADTAAYILRTNGRGMISVKISHDKLSGGAYKVLLYMQYSPNGDGKSYDWRLINELNTTAAGGVFKTPGIGVGSGKFKAVVKCLNSAVPDKAYTVRFSFSARSDCEVEYNDTAARYNEIFPGKTIYGSASYLTESKDCDWYMFRVYGKEAVMLTFEHETEDTPTVCWKITVYDINGNEIYSDNSYFSSKTRNSGRIGVEKGCYFIKVENRVYYDASYSLTVRRMTDLPYESEYNDTRECANAVTLGVPVSGELSERFSGSDKDWYKFTVEKDGYCTFSFSHKCDADEITRVRDGGIPKSGWRITVYASSGETVYSAVSAWHEESTAVSPDIGLAPGDYYVLVDSDGLYHSANPYTLAVDFTGASSWEHEPNNSPSAADTLVPYTPINASLSSFEAGYDTDWFSFTVTEKTLVTVQLDHELFHDAGSYFTLGIYDSEMNKAELTDEKGQPLLDSSLRPVYSVSSFGNQKSTYANSILKPGTYYVRVIPGTKYNTMRYSLTLILSEGQK